MSRVLALAFLLAACGGGEAPPPPAPAAEGPAVRVLAFGDSLTAGKDLEDPDAEAYPALLARRLIEKGWNASVTNAGVSGDTTADALARLDYSLEERPDVVIVALGSNDTFQGKKLQDVQRNLEEIVRRAKAGGAEVLLARMKTFPNLGPYYGPAYEKMFARVAERTGAALTPFLLEGVAGDPALNLPDGIHPNARGHAKIADALMPWVEAAVRRRTTPENR